MSLISIEGHEIGDSHPVFIVAEIGINHNGSLETALEMIDMAVGAGVDMVKFQKRVPELCVPREEWDVLRRTPWGLIPYIDYKKRIEFGWDEYREINKHCARFGMTWTASAWDIPSVKFLDDFDVPCHKVPSAMITNMPLLEAMRVSGKPVIMSTGMSTEEEIQSAFKALYGFHNAMSPHAEIAILHCTSSYPCQLEELNLSYITVLRERYGQYAPIGYSGHETGVPTTLAAVALGAKIIERHVTLNRTMWGTDQSASLEPEGLRRVVRGVRAIEIAMGDGVKKVYDSELPIKAKLRGIGALQHQE